MPIDTQLETVADLVRKQEENYVNGTVTISEYVDFSMHETLEKIDAYLNSKHISGDTDSLGREKPFFDIVSAAVNIWYRATDLDRKNLRIKSTDATYKEWLKAFWATQELKEWMRRERFGAFLNEWGRALARYGSAVVKFVPKGDELEALVVPWNRLIVDAVEFDPNPVIEKLYLTPSQLRKNKLYDEETVESLIDAVSARETIGGQKKDNKADYIEVYELHGELPLSYLTDNDKDDDVYQQQMQVVSFVAGAEKDDYEDFILYRGREAKDPYMLTHLIKEDGRTLSIGAVEHLFEAQWMSNHTAKAIKDQLDLASKLIFQTADGSFIGRNVLTAIETGDILIHDGNELTSVNNDSHDITSLQAYSQQWQALARDITSTPEAIRGETMPSGTAWRQVEALRTESHSLFEIMRENKGLHVEDMLREYIIPHLKKQIKKKHSIISELAKDDADKIDAHYINNLAKAELDRIEAAGEFIDPNQVLQEIESARQKLLQRGTVREQKINQNLYKDYEWEVDFEITNEATNKDAVLTTLSTIFATVASNPLVLQDPNAKMIFNRILEETGAISPVEFNNIETQSQQIAAPQGAMQPQAQPFPTQELTQGDNA